MTSLSTSFLPGDRVAWDMPDPWGGTMSGEVLGTFYGILTIKRVDGGICTIPPDDGRQAERHLRHATSDDILAAVAWFQDCGGRCPRR